MNKQIERRRLFIRITTLIGLVLTLCLSVFISRSNFFALNGPFQQWVASLGWLGPFVFILYIIFQTIIPLIPFGLTNVIGISLFGYLSGLTINIIGMILGSCLAFWLGRRYGEPFIKAFINDKQYGKYVLNTNLHRFQLLLAVGFILPVFPDDVFCMISGLFEIRFKRFFLILVATRPISLVVFTTISSSIVHIVLEFMKSL